MNKPIKKVVSEPVTTSESELKIDVQDTGATTIVTVTGGTLTAHLKAKLTRRYPGAIIIG